MSENASENTNENISENISEPINKNTSENMNTSVIRWKTSNRYLYEGYDMRYDTNMSEISQEYIYRLNDQR